MSKGWESISKWVVRIFVVIILCGGLQCGVAVQADDMDGIVPGMIGLTLLAVGVGGLVIYGLVYLVVKVTKRKQPLTTQDQQDVATPAYEEQDRQGSPTGTTSVSAKKTKSYYLIALLLTILPFIIMIVCKVIYIPRELAVVTYSPRLYYREGVNILILLFLYYLTKKGYRVGVVLWIGFLIVHITMALSAFLMASNSTVNAAGLLVCAYTFINLIALGLILKAPSVDRQSSATL